MQAKHPLGLPMDLVNMRQAKATMATNLTLPADASNDDEGKAELRAELLRIDETLALVNDYRDTPELAAEIENLERLRAEGIALLLLHRKRRMN